MLFNYQTARPESSRPFTAYRRENRSFMIVAIALLLGAMMAWPTAMPVYAAGIVVSSTCTLPNAITSANTDTATGGCTAGSGADTITFDASLSGQTITLVSTLNLTTNITIDGTSLASHVKISGGNAVQVFNITATNTILTHLDIINGKGADGGAIYNEYTLTVNNSTFSNNSAGPTCGGGIYNFSGTLTVNNSTFLNNSAGPSCGSGIYNNSTLTVNNSTFSGNTNNVIRTNDDGTINNSTIYGNPGTGIENTSLLTLKNSILANNTGGDCIDFSGGLGTFNNNLIKNTGANACGLTDGDANGNIIGHDPLLGPLANNGGSTQTMALLVGSPAIDAGDNASCLLPTDQRGGARPIGVSCDIGAFEKGVAIEVLEGSTNIANGGTVSFGSTAVGTPVTKTFTISNTGMANLTLAGLTAPAGFSIATGFGSTTIAPGGTTTFQIKLDATATGAPSGTLSFTNNDTTKTPFNITLNGTVSNAPVPAAVGGVAERLSLTPMQEAQLWLKNWGMVALGSVLVMVGAGLSALGYRRK